MTNVLGLALYGPLAASTRYRLLQYKAGLATRGINLEVHYLLGDEYLSSKYAGKSIPLFSTLKSGIGRIASLIGQRKYDCAIVYSELFLLMPGAFKTGRVSAIKLAD